MTVLATELPQVLDEVEVLSQAMDGDKSWRAAFEQEDVLLFSLGPNGTVMMCAVPRGEWNERQAEYQASDSSRPVTDEARRIVSSNNTARPASSGAVHL
jgi:hypothetical protein